MRNEKVIKMVYVVAMGLFFFCAPTASAQFVLSGTVTDSSMVPLAAVQVLLYDALGNPIGIPLTQTNAAGFYSIAGLPVGTFGLEFIPSVQGHLGETFTGIAIAGNTTFNVMLAGGFHLTGFVRDSLGLGIYDIDLNVYEQISGNKLTTSGDNTDINGFYHITVPGGEYRIRYRPVGIFADPWVPLEIENVIIASDTAIDINMEIGFEVSGTITNIAGGPVVNANLDFFNRTTGFIQLTPGDKTDLTGFYSAILPSGTFDVTVIPAAGDQSLPIVDSAVAINGVMTLNYALEAGLFISGIVRNSLFAPIQNVDIDIIDSNTGVKLITSGDLTNASGFYQVLVPSGTYSLIYQPPVPTGLAPVEIPNTMISTNFNQNVDLPDGLFLSGILLKTVGGAVFNADIDVKDVITGRKIHTSGDNTDASGAFTVVVEPGTYNIEFEPLPTNFLTSVIISNLTLTIDTLLNVVLDTGLVLSGTVLDNLGSPVSNAEVTAVTAGTSDTVYTQFNNSDFTGQYSILIPSGNFDLYFKSDTLSAFIDSIEVINYSMTTNSVLNVNFSSGLPACCIVNRGNVDGDASDNVDVSDLVYLVAFSFQSGAIPPCFEEADLNGSGSIDVSDLVYLVAFSFLGGPTPAVCP